MSDAVLTTSVPSPIGDLALLVHDDILVAAGFGTPEEQHARLQTPPPLRRVHDLGPFSAALIAYFDGDPSLMETLPVLQPGGPFRQAAWKVMREVPAGTTITYAELAERAGSALAARAAGTACAQNLIAPVVPCHRVVRTTEVTRTSVSDSGEDAVRRRLGGYAYGLSRKQWLLAHERGDH